MILQADEEIHLWDVSTSKLVQVYHGHSQKRYVVHSTFGGAKDAFVASGSEDCKVYIWHRVSGQLLAALEGHAGMVSDVAWSPTHPGLVASASDDHTVRLWVSSDLASSLPAGGKPTAAGGSSSSSGSGSATGAASSSASSSSVPSGGKV